MLVERIALTHPLADVLNRHFGAALRAEPVAVTEGMSEAQREGHLRLFRAGRVQVLVATASLEEGIDVPECNVVVRFDGVATTKAHVQGSGRARCPNAEVFYFENCAEEEESKREVLEAVAREPAATLGAAAGTGAGGLEARAGERLRAQDLRSRAPYPFVHAAPPHAEINALNAQRLVYEYIQKTMGWASASTRPRTCSNSRGARTC